MTFPRTQFSSHPVSPNVPNISLLTNVWKPLFCTPVIFSSKVVLLVHADLDWIGKCRSFPYGRDSLVRGSFLDVSREGETCAVFPGREKVVLPWKFQTGAPCYASRTGETDTISRPGDRRSLSRTGGTDTLSRTGKTKQVFPVRERVTLSPVRERLTLSPVRERVVL